MQLRLINPRVWLFAALTSGMFGAWQQNVFAALFMFFGALLLDAIVGGLLTQMADRLKEGDL